MDSRSIALRIYILLLAAVALVARAKQLASDAPSATPAGTTFTAPAGWRVTSGASAVILDPPKPDSHLAIVDVRTPDADSALAAALSAFCKRNWSTTASCAGPNGSPSRIRVSAWVMHKPRAKCW